MKRIVLVFLIVFPFLKNISAQTFQAGFYGGAVASDIPGTDNIDNDVDFEKLGFVIAGTVSTQVTPQTRVQLEIRFIQKGAQQNPEYTNDSAQTATINPTGQYLNDYFTLKLNYVDAVIGIKHAIHFSIRNKTTDRYGIEAGIGVGALLGYSYTVESYNYTLDLNVLDISPFIGIYYNITPHFYAEMRYSNSINRAIAADNNNLNDFYSVETGSWNNGRNVAFSFTLGFVFGNSGLYAKTIPQNPAPSSDNSDN